MSTKIYTAYRTKPGVDLWKLVEDLHKRGREEAVKALKEVYSTVEVDEQSIEYQKNLALYDNNHRRARLSIAHGLILTKYAETKGQHARSVFDFDVAIAIRKHENRFYLIPYCDMCMKSCLNFMAEHPLLQLYGYWDSTDKPLDVSEKEWESRSHIWDAIIEKWDEKLILDIVSYDGFFRVDPFMDLMIQNE
jgi:hypothetical protein